VITHLKAGEEQKMNKQAVPTSAAGRAGSGVAGTQ
jgi:hypothetical protein